VKARERVRSSFARLYSVNYALRLRVKAHLANTTKMVENKVFDRCLVLKNIGLYLITG